MLQLSVWKMRLLRSMVHINTVKHSPVLLLLLLHLSLCEAKLAEHSLMFSVGSKSLNWQWLKLWPCGPWICGLGTSLWQITLHFDAEPSIPLTEEEEWCPNLGVLWCRKAINTKARLGPQGPKQWEWKLQSLWDSWQGRPPAISNPSTTHWHNLVSRDRLHWLI